MARIDTLNFYGDGDDVDAVYCVEETFGISITNEEATATLTVGQLHDLIERKCGSLPTEACYSQIAFYRLRRVLMAEGFMHVGPATPVDILRNNGSIVKVWQKLARNSGLRLPPLETPFRQWLLPRPVNCLAFSGIAASLNIAVWLVHYLTGLAFLVTLFIGVPLAIAAWVFIAQLTYLRLRDIPLRIQTIGDLARESAGFSFSDLKKTKPMSGPADRWQALIAILRDICGHKAPITRETTFFARH